MAAAGEERGGDRWKNSFQEVDESKEKLESVKMAVVIYELTLTYQRGCRLAGEAC